MTVIAGWMDGPWILSNDQAQSAKFWIDGDWIWGPVGSADVNTQHWIKDGWIYRAGGGQAQTGFYIQEGFVFGPSAKLPFA
ncbi:hypothetical protein LJR219_002859 [Phenylobacterium sp. LjRoot219]|uniref:hypothetical protein n=1 Tax=Phenylobacterium sp. LjRoot219 TaxID=3342283 RepID=UPI003ECCCD84